MTLIGTLDSKQIAPAFLFYDKIDHQNTSGNYQMAFFFGIIVKFSLQILKSIHLVCLSFWDISRDPGFGIFILTHKFWVLLPTHLFGLYGYL